MLTGKGIKYVRYFIGETAAKVGYHTYLTRQSINNIEAERHDSAFTRKLLTDYLIKRFDETNDNVEIRGKLASAGYVCDAEKIKRMSFIESL